MRSSSALLALFLPLAACGPTAPGGGHGEDGPDAGRTVGPANNCTADGVENIFVVDTDNHLLSFDPTKLSGGGSPFTLIGTLSCNAGTSLDGGAATPFSMSVDRNGTAWVLYNSGQLFRVSTSDASCENSGYPARQGGMDLFGMGFVSDTAGGDSERLFVAGGNVNPSLGDRRLAVIDTSSMSIDVFGEVSASSENSPELTGTGDAELFGFYPGLFEAFVQGINKNTGAPTGETWDIPGGLGGQVVAWAFAQWGGRFYIFVSVADLFGDAVSTVREIDRETGAVATVINNSAYNVVGAGVSTCAPVTVD